MKILRDKVIQDEDTKDLAEFLDAVIYQMEHPEEPKRVEFTFL